MSKMVTEIASNQNRIFKMMKALNTKKGREKEGLFILEGQRYVVTAIENGRLFEAFAFDNRTWQSICLASDEKLYLEAAPVYILTEALMKEITQTEHSQGIIAVCKVDKKLAPLDVLQSNILFLDVLQDPGNLGTIIRTADAAGFGSIMLAKGTVDAYNPKVVRSTAGSILNVQLIDVEDKEAQIRQLKEKGYKIIVTALENAVDYGEPSCYGALNCIVIGNEANGVSKEIMMLSDVNVKIPILGKAESLNAAVAAALMMYKTNEITKALK